MPETGKKKRKRSSELSINLPLGWILGPCAVTGCRCSCFASCICGHGPASHEISFASKGGENRDEEGDLLRELFACVRNARSVGADGCPGRNWGEGFFALEFPKVKTRRVAGLLGSPLARKVLHDYKTCLRCINRSLGIMTPGKSKKSLPGDAMLVATCLDEVYMNIYYAALRLSCSGENPMNKAPQVSRIGDTSRTVIAPELYFATLSHNPPTQMQVRQTFEVLIHDTASRNHFYEHLKTVWDLNLEGEGMINFPTENNPLLAVLQATWAEISVRVKAPEWLALQSLVSGKDEGTMRGCDPSIPSALRSHCDAVRDWCARIYSFACPNEYVITLLEQVGVQDILEMGAGIGYWKRHFTKKGLDVIALDVNPVFDIRGAQTGYRNTAISSEMNEYHGLCPGWATVSQGAVSKLRSLTSTSSALFVCYPPPEGNMGVDLLREYQGSTFIYAGEPLGEKAKRIAMRLSSLRQVVGIAKYTINASFGGTTDETSVSILVYSFAGDTGTPTMHKILLRDWDIVRRAELPCFPNTAAQLMIFRRKQMTSMKSVGGTLLTCCVCGRPGRRICRRTRAVSFCSAQKCWVSNEGRRKLQIALSLRHLLSRNDLKDNASAHAVADANLFRYV